MWHYKTDIIKQHMPAICNGCDGENIRSQIDGEMYLEMNCDSCVHSEEDFDCNYEPFFGPEFPYNCFYYPFCDECYVTAVQIRDFSLLISTPSCHTEAAKLKDRRDKDEDKEQG